jgi:hypothetical protein
MEGTLAVFYGLGPLDNLLGFLVAGEIMGPDAHLISTGYGPITDAR